MRQRRLFQNFSQEMLTAFQDDPDLVEKVITGDESWVYGYDIEIKAQLKRLEKPRPKKARQVRSNVKVLLIVFFD